jgi:hypothetical protein
MQRADHYQHHRHTDARFAIKNTVVPSMMIDNPTAATGVWSLAGCCAPLPGALRNGKLRLSLW